MVAKGGRHRSASDQQSAFKVALARKDAHLIVEAARGAELELALSEAVQAHYDEAMERGHGEADMSALYWAVKGGP